MRRLLKLYNVAHWVMYLLLIRRATSVTACQVCAPLPHVFHSLPLRKFNELPPGLGFAAAKCILEKRPFVIAGILIAHRLLDQHNHFHSNGSFRTQQKSSEDKSSAGDGTDAKESETKPTTDMSSAMIASIGFYKNFISPLLPPACRFVPTCSQYGVKAISEFGPSKGAILIAWRLLRCSPVGGKGYDPPKWPPVPFTYSSY
jgi:uncharacterized protein